MATLTDLVINDFSTLTATNGTPAKVEALIQVTTNGGSPVLLSALDSSKVHVSTDLTKITVDGLGIFTFSHALDGSALTGVSVSFAADSTLTGKLTVSAATAATVTDIIASDAGLAIVAGAGITKLSGGNGNDALTGGADTTTINANGGNDTLSAGTATGSVAFTGGAGADTFVANTLVAASNVTDYKYADGDVVKSSDTGNVKKYTVSTAGVVAHTTGTDTTTFTPLTAVDNVYKLKVTDGLDKATTAEYWTAAADKAVTMDASSVTGSAFVTGSNQTADITTGVGDDSIDGATLGGAINAGAGTNIIGLHAAGNVDTIVVSKAQVATDAVSGFTVGYDTKKHDVISLYDASITDIALKAGVDSIAVGTTTITGVFGSTAASKNILVKDSGNTVQKVALTDAKATDLADTRTLTVTDSGNEANLFYAAEAGIVDYSAYEKDGLKVDLSNTAKYKGITQITASTLTGGTYVGAAAATTIDASAINVQNSVTVWGGSSAADTIKLSTTKDLADTVFFGAADGSDVVTGFDAGFKKSDDVIRLWGGADFGAPSLTTAAGETVVRVGSAQLDLGAATAAVSLKVQNEAGVTENISYTVQTNTNAVLTGSTLDTATGKYVSANFVIGKANSDVTKTDTVQYADGNRKVDLGDASVYYSIENVVMGAGNATVVGATNAASSLTVAGDAGQTNDVFGGFGVNNDTITLDADTKDTVWYGVGEGNDTVAAGFGLAQDSIRFWDLKLADVAKTYSVTDTVDTNFTAAGNTLKITGVAGGTFNIVTADATTKALVDGGADLIYDAKTKLYFGTDANGTVLTLNNTNTNTATKIDLAGGQGYYYSNVTGINGGTATGYTTLTGAANVAENITAGVAGSVMWGGGLASDTMNGRAGVDEFWFGKGDGIDTATGVGAEDKVVLWNASSINDVTTTVNGNDLVVSVNGASDALTIKGFADAATITFQAGTGSSATTYTYDTVKKAFK